MTLQQYFINISANYNLAGKGIYLYRAIIANIAQSQHFSEYLNQSKTAYYGDKELDGFQIMELDKMTGDIVNYALHLEQESKVKEQLNETLGLKKEPIEDRTAKIEYDMKRLGIEWR